MTRSEYLRTLLRHYVEAPDSPDQPSRRDAAIAALVYHQAVPLDDLLHAIRLATLRRRLNGSHTPVHSLAYYRAVLKALSPAELDPDYVRYVNQRYQLLQTEHYETEPRLESQDPAFCRRR